MAFPLLSRVTPTPLFFAPGSLRSISDPWKLAWKWPLARKWTLVASNGQLSVRCGWVSVMRLGRCDAALSGLSQRLGQCDVAFSVRCEPVSIPRAATAAAAEGPHGIRLMRWSTPRAQQPPGIPRAQCGCAHCQLRSGCRTQHSTLASTSGRMRTARHQQQRAILQSHRIA